MKKPKKPARKFVLIEVETTLSNEGLRRATLEQMEAVARVYQVHVNAAKKERP